VLERFGRVDVLVNNAGVGSFGHVVETDVADWRRMLDVNVTGSFLCARAVLPGMLERGDGCIVNVCSDVSRRVFPGGAGYCASKFAQYAFSQALSAEVRGSGVRVGAVLPGMVATEFAGGKPAEREAWVLRPHDVAEAVAFMVTRPPHAVVDELTVHPVQQQY
jgi:NADP-dependent 3-hydroxy acid dehydrogenase YdfG